MKLALLNKIKLVDNDLTTSVILEKDDFLNSEFIDEKSCLFLERFNLKKIKDFLIEVEDKDWDIYLLLNFNEQISDKDLADFSDLDISDYSEKKVYRVILLSHKILNENLNKLLEETIVIFSDDKLSLDNL